MSFLRFHFITAINFTLEVEVDSCEWLIH
uniref:Uncharacterized protein n=1 Tax=Anguilla anguilla TaxID=7936 RepID=A0A0E9T3C2_ANGAN